MICLFAQAKDLGEGVPAIGNRGSTFQDEDVAGNAAPLRLFGYGSRRNVVMHSDLGHLDSFLLSFFSGKSEIQRVTRIVPIEKDHAGLSLECLNCGQDGFRVGGGENLTSYGSVCHTGSDRA